MNDKDLLNSIVVAKAASLNSSYLFSIDKLDYNPGLVNSNELIDYWRETGIYHDNIRGINGTFYIEHMNIGFFFQPRSNKNIYKIVSNPNDFKDYQKYLKTLKLVLPPDVYNEMKIQTLDIACDNTQYTFEQIDQAVVIGGKQIFERIITKGCEEKTRYAGAMPERFRLYDKKNHSLEKKTKTQKDIQITKFDNYIRIEVSLSKNKLPTKKIEELEIKLQLPEFNPFKKVTFTEFQYTHESSLPITKVRQIIELSRYIELKTLIEHNGLHYAKKSLNTHGNFKRNYGHLINEISTYLIGNEYHKGIDAYFRGLKF